MTTMNFQCDDRYEAEKLASLLSVQRDNTVWLTGSAGLIGNEIVIQLKDRSSHVVVLKDKKVAERLEQLIRRVVSGAASIRSTDSSGSVATIHID